MSDVRGPGQETQGESPHAPGADRSSAALGEVVAPARAAASVAFVERGQGSPEPHHPPPGEGGGRLVGSDPRKSKFNLKSK
jgi:hypothetical protein